MKINLVILIAALLVGSTGCGMLQHYNQGLDNNQRTFERHQKILDEQNEVLVNDLKSKQKQQLIQQALADGEIAAAKAKGDAEAEVERALGNAKANQAIARSLTPLLVQQNLINSLNEKSVIYLPSGVLPIKDLK